MNSIGAFVTFLCVLLGLFSSIDCVNEIQTVYVKSLQCNSSEKFVHTNMSCFAKSYSWSQSTVNIAAYLKKPLNDIYVSYFPRISGSLLTPKANILLGGNYSELQVRTDLSGSDSLAEDELVPHHGKSHSEQNFRANN